jgi:hypothetical protein
MDLFAAELLLIKENAAVTTRYRKSPALVDAARAFSKPRPEADGLRSTMRLLWRAD